MNIYLVDLKPDVRSHLQLSFSYRGFSKDTDDPKFCVSLAPRRFTLYKYKCKPLRRRE